MNSNYGSRFRNHQTFMSSYFASRVEATVGHAMRTFHPRSRASASDIASC